MKKICVFPLLLLSLFIQLNRSSAQTSLAPGDMSFIGFNTNNDAFSVVTFVNLCPGTVFFFTDNGYRNSGGFCTTGEEFCLSFTVTTTVLAGTKITYTDANHPTVGAIGLSPTGGAISVVYSNTVTAGNNNGFNADGDNGFIFQGSYASPSFVCGIKNSGAYNSSGSVNCTNRDHTELPSSLTLGQNALVGCVDIGMRYNCTTLSGSAATLRAAINNLSNWTCSGSAVALPPACSFTVTGVSNPLPVVTAVTSPTIICNGSSALLTAGGANSYTWSSNAGSVTTSTASVSPSTTTTYTVTGNVLGCTNTQTVSVSVTPLPTLTVTPAPGTICNGQSTTLTASGAGTYTWSANAGSVTTNTASVSPASTTVYTVTGTASGCANTQTITVNVTSLPTLTVTPASGTICNGQSTTLTASGAGTYTWSANAGSVTTTTASVSPASTTIYTVTGTSSGCANTQTVSVNVTSLPTLTVTPAAGTICNGQSTTLTASGAGTYTWSANAGSVTTNTASVSPVSTTVYTVTGTASGCANTQTISVNVTPLPVVSITAAPASICNGQSTVLTAGGATTYTWSANAGSVTTTTASVAPAATTTYTVTGDELGCVSTQTVSVIVGSGPAVLATAAQPTICSGQSTILTAGGATTYAWSANAGSVTTNTVLVTPASTTTYTVTGDNSGCSATQVITVTVSPTPTVSVTSSQASICSGQNVTLTASGATGFTWSANAGSAVTNTVSVSPASTTTYSVTGNDAGCTSLQTITVNVNPTPSVVATASQNTICNGQSVLLTASGAAGFTWSANAGSATTNTVSVSPTTTTTYSVTGDGAGCTSSQTITVNVNPIPVVTATASQILVCPGQSTLLTASGAGSFSWSANAGSATTNTVSVSPTSNTTYTVTGNDAGCIATQTVAVGISPSPIVSITASQAAICIGQSAVLTASGASSYTWSVNAGSATTTTVSVSPGASTSYTVTGDSAGCVSTQTISLTVNSVPSLNSISGQTVCAGNTINTIVFNSSANSTVVWSNTNTTIGLPANGTGTINTYTAPTVSVQETGTITALPVDIISGCIGTGQTFTLVVNPNPLLSGTALIDSALCGMPVGGISNLAISGATAPYSYQWYMAGIAIPAPGGTSANLLNVPAGTYNVVVTDANQCFVNSGSYTIPGSQPVLASFSASQLTGVAPLNILFTNNSIGAVNYAWDFGNGSSSIAFNPNTSYLTGGSYTVVLHASNGTCWDTASTIIYVEQPINIIIPTIFSPNGDNVNDDFFITATGILTLNCDIFNRWGQKVYTIDNPNGKWDGKMLNNNQASEGTYYFMINWSAYDGKEYSQQGFLTLVK